MSDQSGERKYEAKSSVSIFGAPVSWVALFGSLIGALSIVPMSFYTSGGGFMSAGMGIFAPLSGMLLGPWAGFVAGTIGGVIGMMISPAAYPLGFLDIILSGSIMPMIWGMFIPKFYKWLLVIFPINALIYLIVPYYYPSSRIGLTPPVEPYYLLSRHAAILSVIVFFLFCKKFMTMAESPVTRNAYHRPSGTELPGERYVGSTLELALYSALQNPVGAILCDCIFGLVQPHHPDCSCDHRDWLFLDESGSQRQPEGCERQLAGRLQFPGTRLG